MPAARKPQKRKRRSSSSEVNYTGNIDLGNGTIFQGDQIAGGNINHYHGHSPPISAEDSKKSFLQWLGPSRIEADHELIAHKRHPGTGVWFLEREEFQQWFCSDRSSTLWCWGPPGAGKSVLASIAINYIREHRSSEDVGIAFTYVRYDSEDHQNPDKIISSFIKQLGQQSQAIPPTALDIYKKYNVNDETPTFGTYDKLLGSIAGTFREVYLVIDALDEHDKDQRGTILDFLFQLEQVLPCIKILITSRRERDIDDAFRSARVPTIQIEAKSVFADIQLFVQNKVDEFIQKRRLRVDKARLKAKIIETLIKEAQGMFLWVSLQLQNLCSQLDEYDIEIELSRLPQGLDNTYKRIEERINQLQPALRELAHKALTLVLYAARPLHSWELIEATAIIDLSTRKKERTYKLEAILESCTNLIIEESDYIRPIHYSVKEYFSSANSFLGMRLADGINAANSKNPHFFIAKTCLSYLQLTDFSQGRCTTEGYLRRRCMENPFAWYAAAFFDHHIHLVGTLSEELEDFLSDFFKWPGSHLSAILQIKEMGNGNNWQSARYLFRATPPTADIATIIYSTRLLTFFQQGAPGIAWLSLEAPKNVLHLAAKAGSVATIKTLIGSSGEIGIDSIDEHGVTPIYYAAQGGHRELCSLLIRQGCNIHVGGGHFGNALQAASQGGHMSVVRLLVENGADVNATGGHYGNALQAAAQGGFEDIVHLLLRHGASASTVGGFHNTALIAGVIGGRLEIVKSLVEKGAEVNVGQKFGTALVFAAQGAHPEMVRYLLEKGAQVGTYGMLNGNALQAAAAAGNLDIVQMLLARKADVHAPGGVYGNAIWAAAHQGHGMVVRQLLAHEKKRKAPRRGRGRKKKGPAKERGSTTALDAEVEDLLHKAELFKKLYAAADRGDLEQATEALEAGAQVNARGGKYGSAWHAAASNGHENILRLLLAQDGASPDMPDRVGRTPLWLAAREGFTAIVELLLSAGDLDVHCANIVGVNMLWWPCCSGHTDVVKLLLEAGVDPHKPNDKDVTPAAAALKNSRTGVLKLLGITTPNEVE